MQRPGSHLASAPGRARDLARAARPRRTPVGTRADRPARIPDATWLLATLCIVALGLAWWASGPWRAPDRTYPVTRAELDAARVALAALPGPDAPPAAPYAREAFGTSWADVDGNGCSTRDDVLARDLVAVELDADGCTVLSGTLEDRYTGTTILFRRGPSTSARVQVDHVVALADAWATGAAAWDDSTRLRFANDPTNLLAVDGPANQAKGASDAGAWLPAESGFHCQYAVLRVRVRAAYGLAAPTAERRALGLALDGCIVTTETAHYTPPARAAP